METFHPCQTHKDKRRCCYVDALILSLLRLQCDHFFATTTPEEWMDEEEALRWQGHDISTWTSFHMVARSIGRRKRKRIDVLKQSHELSILFSQLHGYASRGAWWRSSGLRCRPLARSSFMRDLLPPLFDRGTACLPATMMDEHRKEEEDDDDDLTESDTLSSLGLSCLYLGRSWIRVQDASRLEHVRPFLT